MIYHDSVVDQAQCDILAESSVMLADEVKARWGEWMSTWPENYMKFADGSDSTKLYEAYNVFLCPAPGFAELYDIVVSKFKERQSNYKDYAIAGWVNVYNDGGFLDWHFHGSDQNCHDGRWHGYLCVNGEPSKTLYKDIQTGELIKTIDNKNGYLTMSYAGIAHRTTPWTDKEKPRITIAFDISLRSQLSPQNLNRWIPIL